MTTPPKAPGDDVDLIAAFETVFGPIPRRRYSPPVEPDFDPDVDFDPDPDGYEADRAADAAERYADSRW